MEVVDSSNTSHLMDVDRFFASKCLATPPKIYGDFYDRGCALYCHPKDPEDFYDLHGTN